MAGGPLQPGDPRTLGDFQVVARLGEGGQGIVYEGWAAGGDRVAIKVLKNGADPQTHARLAREIESAQRVAPFCTAKVLAADLDRPDPFVVSEFIEGPSLAERVRGSGPLRDGDLDRLAIGTASALAAIHGAGVVHRDFKPANVLLGPDGPRVVDFGIARPLDAGTAASVMSGTPPFMAPEQLNGVYASTAADVFSWGATMVYAATGRAPFGHEVIAAVFNRILNHEPDLAGVPAGLLEPVIACLSKDPAGRPSARDLMIRLVDPSVSTVAVPGVGPVPRAYVPTDWQVSTGSPPPLASTLPLAPATSPTSILSPDPAATALLGPGSTSVPTSPSAPGSTSLLDPPRPIPDHGPAGGRRRVRSGVLAGLAAVIVVLGVAGALLVRGALGGSGGAVNGDTISTGSQSQGVSADPGGVAGAEGTNTDPDSSTGGAPGPSTDPEPSTRGVPGPSASGSSGGESRAGGTVQVPEGFAGTWSGDVTAQDGRAYAATVVLTPGESEAVWQGADGCKQRATLTKVRDGKALDLTLEQKDLCLGGDMTLTLTDAGTLGFIGQDGGSSIDYRGELRRS
ncbi:Serine/threonine protein kinase [Streptosporangium subroseum]|uniref:Serine/threonine protein kinase n=1 Tax=Streptosporangium subroseum TaxID=106412 RepID=A0A239FR39_9ACTN|nr:serine/threonine-protein kinase [Streptosporangium subroseum]SNS59225.1 Serine/threonine protein kinase [Streptosporangium subroseum]